MPPVSGPLPAVDVVVPAFRRPRELVRLREALARQVVAPASLTVVDDSDTDHGPAWARNVGWRSGQAPVVAFTDDDCVPDPDWVQRIAVAFQDPGLAALEGSLYSIGRDGAEVSHDRPARIRRNRFRTANMAFRRPVLEAVQGFDERYRIQREDTDLAWRVQMAGHAIPFYPEVRVQHPSGAGTERYRGDNELRLYRCNPTFYAECLAETLERGQRAKGQHRRLWAELRRAPTSADLRPLGPLEGAVLVGRALAIALRWRRQARRGVRA